MLRLGRSDRRCKSCRADQFLTGAIRWLMPSFAFDTLRENSATDDAMIIPPTWNLPDAARARLGRTTYGRQRAIFAEGHLLLVLHKPPGPDDTDREGVLFWRNPAGDWQCNRGGPGQG